MYPFMPQRHARQVSTNSPESSDNNQPHRPNDGVIYRSIGSLFTDTRRLIFPVGSDIVAEVEGQERLPEKESARFVRKDWITPQLLRTGMHLRRVETFSRLNTQT
ncbi:hypothetical protein LSAT2_004567 [Lamellibrachia satsuma]|nr:hypothetical protein LSAT2_004567 [Lamellibrachia satsuma]